MQIKGTTFYRELQKKEGLDLRDNRGKQHNMPFILLGLILGLLRKRDGCLSSLHRAMINTHAELCLFLGIENESVISRSHLPRLLKKVDLQVFQELLFQYFKIELTDAEKTWFAGDGKECRGSIEKGNKRGEAVVQLVRHDDRAVLGQSYYNGLKESEKPCIRDLLKETKGASQYVTLDALHLSPSTTELIEQSGGGFIIGLKGNQAEILADMEQCTVLLNPVKEEVTVDKGHGRLEKRSYKQYDVAGEYFDKRWTNSNLNSLIEVQRERLDLSSGVTSYSTDLYMSNIKPCEIDCFRPVRAHWQIEVNNYIRDVTLKEDHLKTKKRKLLK